MGAGAPSMDASRQMRRHTNTPSTKNIKLNFWLVMIITVDETKSKVEERPQKEFSSHPYGLER